MNAFKNCTCCEQSWQTLFDLVKDNKLHVNGYQASFKESVEGLFFFTHMDEGCGTTIAIPAGRFLALYNGPKYSMQMALTERCQGSCMFFDDLEPCSNECNMRWARDVLQILKNHGPEELLARLEEAELQPKCA